MYELIQMIVLGAVLILTLGFILYRLSTRTKSLILNEAPSCHGKSEEAGECEHCHPK